MSMFWMSQKLAVLFFLMITEAYFCLLACAFHPDLVGLADPGLTTRGWVCWAPLPSPLRCFLLTGEMVPGVSYGTVLPQIAY